MHTHKFKLSHSSHTHKHFEGGDKNIFKLLKMKIQTNIDNETGKVKPAVYVYSSYNFFTK